MASMLRTLRTSAIATAVVLYAASAATGPASQTLGQEGTRPAAVEHGIAGLPRMSDDTRAQITALDERIRMLAADMRMFSGELKVDVMASLLTAMLERQELTEREMWTMHEQMMRRSMGRTAPPAPSTGLEEEEPGGMCAPVW